MAWPLFGGTKMVAVSSPLRTQDCPVFGRPSQPRNGRSSQRSRSISDGQFLKGFARADGHGIVLSRDEVDGGLSAKYVSFSQERTARCALSSVHCPLSMIKWMLCGLASCIPSVRSLAAEFSEGPWM